MTTLRVQVLLGEQRYAQRLFRTMCSANITAQLRVSYSHPAWSSNAGIEKQEMNMVRVEREQRSVHVLRVRGTRVYTCKALGGLFLQRTLLYYDTRHKCREEKFV